LAKNYKTRLGMTGNLQSRLKRIMVDYLGDSQLLQSYLSKTVLLRPGATRLLPQERPNILPIPPSLFSSSFLSLPLPPPVGDKLISLYTINMRLNILFSILNILLWLFRPPRLLSLTLSFSS
jgi:hypothetical protein